MPWRSPSEEPGNYRELIAEMAAENTTVSVIGLGTEDDSDAELLRDIAARGGGRIFFSADPTTLPALFAQETVAVARSAFIEDPVGVEPSSGWLELSSRGLQGLTVVDGYNLSYLREEATGAAFTTDDYQRRSWRFGIEARGALRRSPFRSAASIRAACDAGRITEIFFRLLAVG
ncbi:MAG: hypothetical protein E2P02_05990 [Acidobacteria bacterium]|nr:MAG: hypothetical protein E2P02_05990 [Acidobacteriota bacterium]